MAQVSAPTAIAPAFVAISETLVNTAQQARNNPFLTQEPIFDRVLQTGKIPPQVSANGQANRRALAIAEAPLLAPSAGSVPAALVGIVTAPLPYLQTATFQNLNILRGASFDGLGVGTPGFSIAGAPSGATIGISPTQVVQWVNSQIAVYDKAGTPLLPAPGFINGNAIWASFDAASLCKTTNRGSPMVQYDRISRRWILTQFAFNSGFSRNSQCIAVSVTDDARGAYYLYEYSFGNQFPNDAKLAVWTDGYYITYNMYTNGTVFSGARSCAYNKEVMLVGGPTPDAVCFDMAGTAARFAILPGDLDGTNLPPPGTANPQITWNYPFKATAPYKLQLSKFKPNFVTPALSTFDDGFGGATLSSVDIELDASTIAACNDGGGVCIPQLGTTQLLDSIGNFLNYRLVYRNFGTHDALLFTQAVDPSTSPVAAVRWWEIRNPNTATPLVYQNSTFAPGTESRWNSSAAFDKRGNIAVGYTASSPTLNPSIRITGRLRNDPKNLMRTELDLQTGTGSQTTNLNRWGQQSTMQIDPTDDCTFWYTSQYLATDGRFNWRTRIASFKFPNCQ